jgi:cation transport regulator
MPYTTVSDLPHAVKDHLPPHAQEIYMEAYNSALELYSQPGKRRDGASTEEIASRVAWAAVKKKYEKRENSDRWQEKP